ncbi:MAG: hypothetical protein ISR91_06200 [Candidatus Delongbacteria bacterium]|nr:hypothetical protein [bacterium]MBL7033718.1 hypothetical protein [Candidatus Delongbacteria bacterium]
MRIIKKDEIRTATTGGAAVTSELVEIVTDRQREQERRDSLRTGLERNLLRRQVERLEKQIAALTRELETDAASAGISAENAHAAGLQEGIEQGLQQGKAEAQELIHSLRDLLAEAHLQRQDLVVDAGKEVIELATVMARLLVGEVFRLKPEVLLVIIGRLLDEYANAAPFRIALHPLDLEMLKREGFTERLSQVRAELVEAAEVPRHQCRVEMAQGLVELGEQQLAVIKRTLIEQLEVIELE